MNPIYGIWAGYVVPVMIISSLLSNSVVILMNKYLSKSGKLRFYYSLVAAVNLVNTFTLPIESLFLGDGLSYATDGKLTFIWTINTLSFVKLPAFYGVSGKPFCVGLFSGFHWSVFFSVQEK